MFYHSNDNKKIHLKDKDAVIINNNSKVYLDNTNIIQNEQEYDYNTITINKGITTNYFSTEKPDIVYGNSKTFSIDNLSTSFHQFFTDFNFPNAKYHVNGYKTNFAILLNNGISAFWTPANKGVLIDNIEINDIDLLPTRLNGYTATLNLPAANYNLQNNYNGTIILNVDDVCSLSANKISNLQVNNLLSGVCNFKNIDNLSLNTVYDSINLENIKNSQILNSYISLNNITVKNTAISISNLGYINFGESYNSFGSLFVDSNYEHYILSGSIDETKITNDQCNNVFINNIQYEKFTKHYINTTSSDFYQSNTPIGTIVWYPEVWSSYSPSDDKESNKTDGTVTVYSYGDPLDYNWKLCDGQVIGQKNLYYKLYSKTRTPNYKVKETYKSNLSSYHFLNEPSILLLPPNLVTITPLSTIMSEMGSRVHDNEHKLSNMGITQTDNGLYGYVGPANWRLEQTVIVNFNINVGAIPTYYKTPQNIKNIKIRFNSYACSGGGSDGDAWWRTWCGGNLNTDSSEPSQRVGLLDVDALPSSNYNGQIYVGGHPYNKVIGKTPNDDMSDKNLYKYTYLKDEGLIWYDTKNIPKIAFKMQYNKYVKLNCVSTDFSGTPLQLAPLRLTKEPWNTRRICNTTEQTLYQKTGNISIYYEEDGSGGSDHAREIQWKISTDYLLSTLLLKTYEFEFKENQISSLPSTINFNIKFRMELPAIENYQHCYTHSNPYPSRRWEWQRRRDINDQGVLYNQRFMTENENMLPFFLDPKICLYDMEFPILNLNGTQKSTMFRYWQHSGEEYDLTKTQHIIIGDRYEANIQKCYAMTNTGLYRRMNPWIKINANKSNKSPQTIADEKGYMKKNKKYVPEPIVTKVISLRKGEDIFNNTYITKNNISTLSTNLISSCYIPNNYTNLSTNNNYLIENFYQIYDESKISSKQVYNNITFNFNDNSFIGTIISCHLKDGTNIAYISGQARNKILSDINYSSNYNFNVPYFKNETHSDETNTYTYYTCKFDSNIGNNCNGTIQLQSSLKEMNFNYNVLENVLTIISSQLDKNGYINTTNNIPLLQRYDNITSIGRNYIVNNTDLGTYFLCTENRVCKSNNEVETIIYSVNSTSQDILTGKLANPTKTSATMEYSWDPSLTTIPRYTKFDWTIENSSDTSTYNTNNGTLNLSYISAIGQCSNINEYTIDNTTELTTYLSNNQTSTQIWDSTIKYIPANTDVIINGVLRHIDNKTSVNIITSGLCNGYIITNSLILSAIVKIENNEQQQLYVYTWDLGDTILPNTSAIINEEVIAFNSTSVVNINTIGTFTLTDNFTLQYITDPEIKTTLKIYNIDEGGNPTDQYVLTTWTPSLTTLPPYTYTTAQGETTATWTPITTENTLNVQIEGLGKVNIDSPSSINTQTTLNTIKGLTHQIFGENEIIGNNYILTTNFTTPLTSTDVNEAIVSRLSSYVLYLSSQILNYNTSLKNRTYEQELANYMQWSTILPTTFNGTIDDLSGITN